MKKNFLKRIGTIILAAVVTVTSVNVPYIARKAEVAQAAKVDKVLQSWDFSSGISDWYYGGSGWEYNYKGGANTSISTDQEMLKVSLDYSLDSSEAWSQLAVSNCNSSGMNLNGANKVTLDFIYDESKLIKGGFKIKAFSNGGINSYADVNTANAVTVSGTLKKVPITISFDAITNTAVKDFNICIIGSNTDYKGEVWLDNINIISETESATAENELKAWTFDSSVDNWYYGSGWEYQYDAKGIANSGVSYENGKLKVDVDYSYNSGESWSQMATCVYDSAGMNLVGANKVTFDFYYDTSKMTTGSFLIKASSNAGIDASTPVDMANAVVVEGTIKKATVTLTFDALTSEDTAVNDFAIAIVGNKTDYKGSIWLDNIKLLSITNSAEDIYVNSTVKATGGAVQEAINNGNLESKDASNNTETTALSNTVTMVDKDATDAAKQTYSYLEAVGKSSSAIFGHQGDTHDKAGSKDLSYSDTYDVTGSYSGVIGIDALSLVGNEYSASRYNSELGAATGAAAIPTTAAGNVQAAAALTNYNIKQGAIITLSAHMPNFSLVAESGTYDGTHSYSNYNFSGYSPNTLTGDVMNQILPGGKYNTVFTAYLDMIADYANQVDGAILFRPFHENTGSWFWWGAAFCDAVTYQNVYRYTVEYLRDTKDVHNLIYVYGPSSEAASTNEYEVRYPGDNYVDMVGFDMYNINPTNDDTWFNSFKNELNIVQTFATAHNKLFAVTETGVATNSADKGDNQTALHKSGNAQLDWYQKMLSAVTASNASYFLVWANFSEKDGFYTPYVKKVNTDGTLYGHEMLDKFIEFYNDPSSIFAVNQKEALTKLSEVSVTAKAVTTNPTGYITSPISGSRLLNATTLTAKITNATAETIVKFVLHGTVDKEITASAAKDGVTYVASLDAATLAALGANVGTIELVVNGTSMNTINATFNIPEPVEDPYQIDGFENYYGVESLLAKKWVTNKATGNTISVSLTKENDKYYSGNYGMKFAYNETSDGWAGATISKDVNWSNCNALQFWTIPDGNNQKVVVQLTANATVYEVYLNLYDGYKNSTSPMLVTIPFSEFCKRDTSGHPKGGLVNDCSSVTSFGLWVNAIAGTPAVVDGKVSGTIYYDNITAVNTTKTEATFEVIKPTVTPSTTPTETSTTVEPTTTPTVKPTVAPTVKPTVTPTVTPRPVISKLKTTTTTQASSENEKLNTRIKSLITDNSKLQYVAVNVNGKITNANKSMKVYVASLDGIKEGSKVYVYAYNNAKDKLERLNKTIYTVDKDNYITMNVNRDTQYVFLNQEVKGENVLTRAEQTTVKDKISVNVGSKKYIHISMYDEFVNKAAITYKISDNSLATINKDGLINAKKKGSVIITTIVKIGYVSKEFATEVTIR